MSRHLNQLDVIAAVAPLGVPAGAGDFAEKWYPHVGGSLFGGAGGPARS